MKTKKKIILLSSTLLAIAGIGAPIVLTSCGNTTSQSTNTDGDDNNDNINQSQKVDDVVVNQEIDGNLKYPLTKPQNQSQKQMLIFSSTYKDDSGQKGSKSIDELKKEIAPSRTDWSGPTSDEQENEIYTLNNYNDVSGFTYFISLATFIANDDNKYSLDKNDINYETISSESLNKSVEILKNTTTTQGENDSIPLTVIISISLKPDFVWKSNNLNYDLFFVLYLFDKEEITQ